MVIAVADVFVAFGANTVVTAYAGTVAAFAEFMSALTEVTVSAGGAKTVRSTVTYSVSAFHDIMGATVTEIAFAGGALSVLACGTLSVSAGHFGVVTVAEIIAANIAGVVEAFLAMEMSAGTLIVSALAEISVTGGAGLVVARLTGGMSAGKGFMAALAKITLTVGARIVFAGLTGSVSARHFLVTTHGKVTATDGAIFNNVGMVVAVAVGQVANGADFVVAYGTVTAAMRTILYCRSMGVIIAVTEIAVAVRTFCVVPLGNILIANGAKFGGGVVKGTNIGGDKVDVFCIATGNIDEVACDFIGFAVLNSTATVNKRNDSTVQAFKRNVEIIATDGNGGDKGNISTLGKGSQLTFKKEFVRFHRSGMLNGALAETLNRLNRFQFHNVGISHFGTNHSGLVAYSKFVLYFSIDVKVVTVFIGQQKGGRRYGCNSPRHTVVLI